MDVLADLSPLSPGLIDELEAFMAPVGDCGYPPQPERRIGGHQLPESPPDSGSEHPYSPESHITVPSVLGPDYMLVHDPAITHDMLQQSGDYIYEELKSDGLGGGLTDVVVLPSDGLVDLNLRAVRHDMAITELPYPPRYNLRVDLPDLEPGLPHHLVHDLHPVYPGLGKKRRLDGDELLKCETPAPPVSSPPPAPRPPASAEGSEAGDEPPFQSIRFAPFQQGGWHALCDQYLKPLPATSYVVGADKGFNYSQIDEAFVCQKKNHFQVTCQMQINGDAQYVKTGDGFKKIGSFFIHFYGVKAEDPTQEVRVEQSQSDRTKKPFHPVPVELRRDGSKVTVGRLHFAETTNNNMRKKGRPNPDQRHFQLAVALKAHCGTAEYIVAAQASDRIIVRASNPGQFESDCTENWWQRGASDNSVHYHGRVGINTDRPDESCVIHGNLKVTGHIVHPSDARAKHNIEELDTAQQLKNVQSIRVVKFNYDTSFAEHSGLLGFDPNLTTPTTDTGVIAQEVRTVIPDAVKEAGDVTLPSGDKIHKFLVVDKDRIFMENLGAVKELCKVTGHLENRINQLERINKRRRALQRRDSAMSSISNDSRYSAISNSSKSLYSDGNISIEQIRDIARNIRRQECCHKLNHNSPKYTRKQCKSCREHPSTSKYGKYYNYNKTNCVKYNKHENKSEHVCQNAPMYVDSESNKTVKQRDEDFSTLSKKKDTCLWVQKSEDNFNCGNTRFIFCCRRKDVYDTEFISNKFLQIVITILIFIMAVCLVVMSALYFKEHHELLSMKQSKMQDHFSSYPGYGKFSSLNTGPPHRPTLVPDNLRNQIQNSKHSQHATVKKAPKEKGTHKTTPEYITTPSVVSEAHAAATLSTLPVTLLPASKMHVLQPQQPPSRSVGTHALSRSAEALGSGCALDNALNAELDADCQSSCSLDPSQPYDQEPLERNSPDKDVNETTNYARLEPAPKEPVIQQLTPENNSGQENDSLKSILPHDEINVAESNSLDKGINGTENETARRLKRDGRYTDGRRKRDTGDFSRLSSETDEMALNEQSDEDGGLQDCDRVTFGVRSKTFGNDSMFEESVCAGATYNVTYRVPVSKCLKDKLIDMSFKSSKFKQLRLCDLQCKFDGPKQCHLNREIAKPIQTEDAWTSKMTLECNMDRDLRLRAGFTAVKDLCFLTSDQKIPFVEYNIRIFRDCHN